MTSEIIVALISLAGVIITAYITKSSFTKELDKKIAVIEVRLDNLSKKVDEHNGYAKLFSENLPVLKKEIEVVNHRIKDLESKVN